MLWNLEIKMNAYLNSIQMLLFWSQCWNYSAAVAINEKNEAGQVSTFEIECKAIESGMTNSD